MNLTLLKFVLTSTLLAATNRTHHNSNMCWLRIIQINDVYELACFPRLKTLVDKQHQQQQEGTSSDHDEQPDKTLIVCAGDFLAPSLLSSLDKGASMVDCLNAVGVTHVCFGNHEADVPTTALRQRIQEQSKLTWVNSNMQDLNAKLSVETPEYSLITVSSKKGPAVNEKVVALLGLLTDDPSLYRPGAFDDAKIDPVAPCATALVEKLSSLGADLIIPMTHQSIDDDRTFCRAFTGHTFPIVCGGHDHEVYDEVIEGSRIIKAGMDATNAAIIDIQWNNNSNDPTVKAEIVPTKDYDPDPELQRRIDGHQRILHELERARLFCIKDWMNESTDEKVFSTENNRLGPSTGTSALCSMLRMGMRAQCAIINAGAVRGNKVYRNQKHFAWSDLKAEIPFSTGMTACFVPGKVLEETIAHSRRGSQHSPPKASGGYLHTSRNIKFSDTKSCKIESVGGKPFDPDQLYLTAMPAQFFDGIDNHKPLLDWAAGQAGPRPSLEESAVPAKMVLVEVFSALLWLQLGSFDEIDENHDGILQYDEVKARVLELYGDESVAELVLQNMFSVADMSGDATITPLEMMIVQFAATDLLDHVCTESELRTMKQVASQVLGKNPSHDDVRNMVERLRETIDLEGDGKIDRSEVMKVMGRLKQKQLLE